MYKTLPQLIELLQSIDKRRYAKTPYITGIDYHWLNKEYVIKLTSEDTGGYVKEIRIKVGE